MRACYPRYWEPSWQRRREESHRQAVVSTWFAIARLRRRGGDLAGSDRATRQARMSRPLRMLPPPPREPAPRTMHYATDLPGRGGIACGSWVISGDNITGHLELVDCGNCVRTKVYRKAMSKIVIIQQPPSAPPGSSHGRRSGTAATGSGSADSR